MHGRTDKSQGEVNAEKKEGILNIIRGMGENEESFFLPKILSPSLLQNVKQSEMTAVSVAECVYINAS